MDRRRFLNSLVAGMALYGAGALPGSGATAWAQNGFAPVHRRTLVNVMMKGGPDWRHVMPPEFDPTPGTYGHEFWRVRARAYGVSDSASAMQAAWNDRFDHYQSGSSTFGILKSCGWLSQMYAEGNVAVVCNVVGSQSRDHLLSELILNQGNRSSGPNDFERSGWGGRLASVLDSNIVSLSSAPSPFVNGLHPSGDMNRYYVGNHVGIRDTRRMGLYEANPDNNPRWDARGNVTRALETFYAALRNEADTASPYSQFVDHEAVVRQFGAAINERLMDVAEPAALKALYEGGLNSQYVGKQFRNLFDVLACNDLLNMRVASMEIGGWDTHDGQGGAIEKPLSDLFALGGGMDALWQSLPDDARDNSVFVFCGEFGRQLVANGANGTDHGRGTSYVIVGRGVNGGVYGEQFPEAELARLDDPSPDIEGLTEFDQVLAPVCDWVGSGTGSSVFPERTSAMLEAGSGVASLMSSQA